MKKGSYLIIFLILFFSISNVKAVDQKLQCSYIKEETEKLEQKYEELLKEHEELLKQLGTTTAEEGDILEGKKAYSKGQLLTGTLPNNGNLTSTIKSGDSYTLKNGFYEESKIKVLTLAEQTKANATNNKILLGYTAWVNGEKVIGTNKGYEQGKNDGNHDGYEQGFNDGKKGTAIASDVLQTKTFTNQTSVGINGTMKKYSNSLIFLQNGDTYNIPTGYHDGTERVQVSTCSYRVNQTWSYSYTGGVQQFTVPCSGQYYITVRGARGGDLSFKNKSGGNGSVRGGAITLKKGQVLYVFVGQNGPSGGRHSHGSPESNPATFNGGAESGYDEGDLGRKGRYWTHGSGGGATDIRIGGTGVNNQVIVAGGGGGADKQTNGTSADSGGHSSRRLYGYADGGGGGYYGGWSHRGGSSYVSSIFTNVTAQNGTSGSGSATIVLKKLDE